MPSMPWFRMYHEFATDPKVQMLSEADQRRFVMLLCMRCSNGDVTLQDSEVAFQLRISDDEWQKTKTVLVDKKMIDETNRPTKWDQRQKASDTSKDRVFRHRQKKKQEGNGACNVTVTAQKKKEKEREKKKKRYVRFLTKHAPTLPKIHSNNSGRHSRPTDAEERARPEPPSTSPSARHRQTPSSRQFAKAGA